MSQSSDALSQGFDALNDCAGETVSFRDVNISAIIDRTPVFPDDPATRLNFGPRGWSVIEIKAALVTGGTPKGGETVTEPDGHKHRIEKVFPRPDSYVLHCKVTPS